jgi:hypothetical protein
VIEHTFKHTHRRFRRREHPQPGFGRQTKSEPNVQRISPLLASPNLQATSYGCGRTSRMAHPIQMALYGVSTSSILFPNEGVTLAFHDSAEIADGPASTYGRSTGAKQGHEGQSTAPKYSNSFHNTRPAFCYLTAGICWYSRAAHIEEGTTPVNQLSTDVACYTPPCSESHRFADQVFTGNVQLWQGCVVCHPMGCSSIIHHFLRLDFQRCHLSSGLRLWRDPHQQIFQANACVVALGCSLQHLRIQGDTVLWFYGGLDYDDRPRTQHHHLVAKLLPRTRWTQ